MTSSRSDNTLYHTVKEELLSKIIEDLRYVGRMGKGYFGNESPGLA